MKKLIAVGLISAMPALFAGCGVEEAGLKKPGAIERLLPAFDALVPA
ncbi:MAG: hypothetical protein HKO71_08125, partial [Pseudomonadales bacterium]|nr:hypothetical protein [Pseudomonadales bacterium]